MQHCALNCSVEDVVAWCRPDNPMKTTPARQDAIESTAPPLGLNNKLHSYPQQQQPQLQNLNKRQQANNKNNHQCHNLSRLKQDNNTLKKINTLRQNNQFHNPNNNNTITINNNNTGNTQQQQPQQQLRCSGCRKGIRERFLLKALDRLWHEDCLKCSCCDCRLGEVGSSLFSKANLLLCRRDYLRLFGTTGYCSVCNKMIPSFEMVMRARHNVYHLECFACQQCSHRFCVGDRYYLYENKILCEYDYEEKMLIARASLEYLSYHCNNNSINNNISNNINNNNNHINNNNQLPGLINQLGFFHDENINHINHCSDPYQLSTFNYNNNNNNNYFYYNPCFNPEAFNSLTLPLPQQIDRSIKITLSNNNNNNNNNINNNCNDITGLNNMNNNDIKGISNINHGNNNKIKNSNNNNNNNNINNDNFEHISGSLNKKIESNLNKHFPTVSTSITSTPPTEKLLK